MKCHFADLTEDQTSGIQSTKGLAELVREKKKEPDKFFSNGSDYPLKPGHSFVIKSSKKLMKASLKPLAQYSVSSTKLLSLCLLVDDDKSLLEPETVYAVILGKDTSFDVAGTPIRDEGKEVRRAAKDTTGNYRISMQTVTDSLPK
ncbi:MAG: hypothetical protein WB676_30880 [Bryobacteraceae bacterium]